MIRLWVRHEAFEEAERYVRAMGKPFEIHETSSSRGIKNEACYIRTSEHYLGRAILSHLVCCKAEILANAKDKDLLIPENLRWFDVSKERFGLDLPPRRMFVNEFDLNHAYWRVAFRLGFIGEKTYQKFLSFKTKHFRLIALGMLAKREYIRRFDAEGNEIASETKVDEVGVQIFRRIAYEVTKEMRRLSEANAEEFLFYWFDNIVFTRVIRSLETEYAYRCSPETLRLLYVPRRKFILSLGGREFSFPIGEAFKGGEIWKKVTPRIDTYSVYSAPF
jgi:hypothetical protein